MQSQISLFARVIYYKPFSKKTEIVNQCCHRLIRFSCRRLNKSLHVRTTKPLANCLCKRKELTAKLYSFVIHSLTLMRVYVDYDCRAEMLVYCVAQFIYYKCKHTERVRECLIWKCFLLSSVAVAICFVHGHFDCYYFQYFKCCSMRMT